MLSTVQRATLLSPTGLSGDAGRTLGGVLSTVQRAALLSPTGLSGDAGRTLGGVLSNLRSHEMAFICFTGPSRSKLPWPL
ncbi:MAG: hypothetical protein E4G95_01480 [Bacteroidia bacterium]|nr:MAG: hypothetical protein E4G95_01480 [Bacteroidia bacterium]